MTVSQINGILVFFLGAVVAVILTIAFKEIVLENFIETPRRVELIVLCSIIMPLVLGMRRFIFVFKDKKDLWYPINSENKFSLRGINKSVLSSWFIFYLGGAISLILIYYFSVISPVSIIDENVYLQYFVISVEMTPFIAGILLNKKFTMRFD